MIELISTYIVHMSKLKVHFVLVSKNLINQNLILFDYSFLLSLLCSLLLIEVLKLFHLY